MPISKDRKSNRPSDLPSERPSEGSPERSPQSPEQRPEKSPEERLDKRPSKRIVGIDYGTRRVGIAVTDPLALFAQPHGTFSPEDALVELSRINSVDGISTIVIGWPLTPAGEEGRMTNLVQEYINRLKKRFPLIEVVTWDETNTSVSAEEILRASGAKRKKRREKGVLDRLAAAVILQEFLASRD